MHTAHIWDKFDIHRRKIGFTLLFLFIFFNSYSQRPLSESGQDDAFISYGFFLAGHTNSFRIRYSDAFMDPNRGINQNLPQLQNIHSIQPVFSQGFSLGFLTTLRLHDQFNLLFTPKVGFYEYRTEVNYFTRTDIIDPEGKIYIEPVSHVSEATLVEFPLLLKYKSQRFNNTRMYFIGGANAQFRTKGQEEANEDSLVILGSDLALELGMGFDIYFEYFKFSPEIRFSHGLRNLYKASHTDPMFAEAITDIRMKTITIYLNFQ
ncbi:type IX secretion/gliding motility protein PorT/SprT [Anditalea andensis]|uniref:Port-like protein n=1 Tax=Anditalea andensis TaxID=1048983 RepID=A0A074KUR0_9BACT|nr:outer membrane beta-barrel protein [Anditalea andensis]KEO73706.1 port-like protein [Anditalea andensis]